MHFFKKLDAKFANIVKISALGLLALVAIVFIVSLTSATVKPFFEKGIRSGISQIAPGMPSYDSAVPYGKGGASDESMRLSVDNVQGSGSILPPVPIGTTGSDAEEFEVTEYYATIETRQSERDCAAIAGLKAREYVIFESANEYDKGCNYTFKVARKNVPEALAFVKDFDPKELSEITYTIKRQIEDFTSEMEILKNKLSSIDDTLRSALRAYDEVTALATRTANAEALAKVIDSKVGVIERLTQERINLNAQLERMERAKRDQLDRLLYTYFHVNVYENKFVDGDALKDSWKAAVKEFVSDINQVAQDVTVNLAGLLFILAQYALYLFIALFAAKYGWRVAKDIWKR